MKEKLQEITSNKFFKPFVILFMIIILFIIGINVYFAIVGRRINNYSKLEDVITNAAKKYYTAYPDKLPKEIGGTSTIDDVTLSNEKYMKQLINIAPKDTTCKAEVTVKNINGGYTYITNLDCGSHYKSKILADQILDTQQVVTVGDGLYLNNGDYVYRGEYPKNFIKFAGTLYRIVSINADKTITIINSTYNKERERISYDDRYNKDSNSGRAGINDYALSRIKDNLLVYVNSDAFSDLDRSKLMYQSLCVGKVNDKDIYSRNMECSQKLDNQIIGLLPTSNFNYASLDSNCKEVGGKTCQNYNYLSKFDSNWWTMTGNNERTYKAYGVGYKSYSMSTTCSNQYYPREVLRLTELVNYVTGNGTEEAPFEIK